MSEETHSLNQMSGKNRKSRKIPHHVICYYNVTFPFIKDRFISGLRLKKKNKHLSLLNMHIFYKIDMHKHMVKIITGRIIKSCFC